MVLEITHTIYKQIYRIFEVAGIKDNQDPMLALLLLLYDWKMFPMHRCGELTSLREDSTEEIISCLFFKFEKYKNV